MQRAAHTTDSSTYLVLDQSSACNALIACLRYERLSRFCYKTFYGMDLKVRRAMFRCTYACSISWRVRWTRIAGLKADIFAVREANRMRMKAVFSRQYLLRGSRVEFHEGRDGPALPN